MSTNNLNAIASQLAIDVNYYESKALECWELVTQLQELSSLNTSFTFTLSPPLSVGGVHISLPVETKALPTLNSIIMALMSYYRCKYAESFVALQQLKASVVDAK